MTVLASPALLTLESVALDQLSAGNDFWRIDFSSIEKDARMQRLRHVRGPRLRHSRFDLGCSISAVSSRPYSSANACTVKQECSAAADNEPVCTMRMRLRKVLLSMG